MESKKECRKKLNSNNLKLFEEENIENSIEKNILVAINKSEIHTPAIVYSEKILRSNLAKLICFSREYNLTPLYSLKANCIVGILKIIAEYVKGFDASSPYEANFVSSHFGLTHSIHLTSPGLFKSEFLSIINDIDFVNFNSISQYHNLSHICPSNVNIGIRVNPGVSHSEYPICDPGRLNSKLGIPLMQFNDTFRDEVPKDITGFHFHITCNCKTFAPHILALTKLFNQISTKDHSIAHVNVGGGINYLETMIKSKKFKELVASTIDKYQVEFFFEPGEAVVTSCGYFVTKVLDKWSNLNGSNILVTDASIFHVINHLIYNNAPTMVSHRDNPSTDGYFIVVGRSCLPADIFGEYSLLLEPEIGDNIVFSNQGTYNYCKSSWFNGIPIPNHYLHTMNGNLIPIKEHNYSDFVHFWG